MTTFDKWLLILWLGPSILVLVALGVAAIFNDIENGRQRR